LYLNWYIMEASSIHIIRAENFLLDGGATFGVVPKSIWGKLWPANDNNMLSFTCRLLLVEEGDKRILIDTGIGDKQSEKFREHLYLFGDNTLEKSLNNAGFAPTDITDVLLTHLHYDHCGGGVRKNSEGNGFVLTFPNARYWCSQRQWDWAMNPNSREGASFFKENLLPMKESGHLAFIEDQQGFSAAVNLLHVHGHTDGQMIPMIHYKGRCIVFMADFIISAGHIPLPYVAAFDTRPLLSMQEKEAFLKEALDKNYILFFEHALHQEASTVRLTDKGIRADRIGSLDELLNT
jgi:glyoxylase-like metal-dependent hydrolase (beta-lactamase superfamily II)